MYQGRWACCFASMLHIPGDEPVALPPCYISREMNLLLYLHATYPVGDEPVALPPCYISRAMDLLLYIHATYPGR
ncbi:hypothetical protein CEXT_105321 [Caerostris extrusa]|uniref:Uncharacterized protein n=1 Tax=Caerostris extrusa TaxID=172846 RepID=A0AAV4Y273_CAEEX|nr:hypothetical protein CEXT_105321 [Caerostris extrusa]